MVNDPLFIRFAERLKKSIISEIYPVGSSLPPVRQLESDFKISRNTVMDALKLLADDGFIAKDGPRKGYRIIKEPEAYETEPHRRIQQVAHCILPYNYHNHVGNTLLEYIETIFFDHHVDLILSNTKHAIEVEQQIISRIQTSETHLAQTFILMPSGDYQGTCLEALKQINEKTPIILIDRYLMGMESHYVGVNNQEIGYCATTHLLDKGHQKIGYLGASSHLNNFKARVEGYRTALEQHSIALNKDWIFLAYKNLKYDQRRKELQRIVNKIVELPQLPTAFVCSSDKNAHVLIDLLLDKGIRVPQDMAIVGCNYDLYFQNKAGLQLTTFLYPYQKMAEEIFSLFELLKSSPEASKKLIEFTVDFIPGETS